MKTTQWTPGPWNVHDNIGRKGQLGVIAETAPCIIAIMGNQKQWPMEAQANARLIALAPEMATALRVLLEFAVECDAHVETHYLDEMGEAAMSQARAILAKLEGGQA